MKNEKRDNLDKFLDFILTKNTAKYLTLIVLLGAVLRYFVVKNISFLGDEMVHGPHAINMWSSGLISTVLESPTWFYLTDIAHKILGVTIFSTRFLSFFYGTLSILALYLLTKLIFNKKTALLASSLFAVSAFQIRYTLIEMDHSMTFFLLMGTYFFIKHFKEEKESYLYISALLLGTGVLIKTITAYFIPPLIIFYFILKKDKKFIKNIKPLLKFIGIIALFTAPIIFHNILLYKHQGRVDTYFAQYFDINVEAHTEIMTIEHLNPLQLGPIGLIKSSYGTIQNVFFKLDPLIFALGIIGMLWAIKKRSEHREKYLLITLFLFGWILQTTSNTLPTHFTVYIPFLCMFSSDLLTRISKLKLNKKNAKRFLIGSFMIILIANLFFIPDNISSHLTSQTANAKMREFTIDNIQEDSLVVVDSRIYRGRIAWLFNDRHYLESAYFPQVLQARTTSQYNIPTKTYFVECARDDCGWGTIGEGNINTSSENIVNLFEQNSQLIKTFNGGGGYDEETGEPYFRVYKTVIDLPQGTIQLADSTHQWFYYPLHYTPKESNWDYYTPKGLSQNTIWWVGKFILYISILLALLAPLLLFYELKNPPKRF
tara:strand:+ start:1331 stop:3130 length:1800 start_codon:yes stop_codon:yes gene_type:complete